MTSSGETGSCINIKTNASPKWYRAKFSCYKSHWKVNISVLHFGPSYPMGMWCKWKVIKANVVYEYCIILQTLDVALNVGRMKILTRRQTVLTLNAPGHFRPGVQNLQTFSWQFFVDKTSTDFRQNYVMNNPSEDHNCCHLYLLMQILHNLFYWLYYPPSEIYVWKLWIENNSS